MSNHALRQDKFQPFSLMLNNMVKTVKSGNESLYEDKYCLSGTAINHRIVDDKTSNAARPQILHGTHMEPHKQEIECSYFSAKVDT